jgi:DNA replication and repair protein RecF
VRLLRLHAARFRNLEPFDLDVSSRFVVLHGDNAQGKTNTLEAVYLLATLKPLRGRSTRDLVRWGESEAYVAARVVDDVGESELRIDIEPSRRRALVDGQPSRSVVEYFDRIRAVAFTPSDLEIVAGEPARRRAWLDRAAFTATPGHLDAVQRVRRCLSQKSAALREGRPNGSVLDALDEELAVASARLVARRVALLAELRPHVTAVYPSVAGSAGRISLVYRTAATGEAVADRAEALRRALADARGEELRRRQTLCGPQRDDVLIKLDGQGLRTWGSRGQIRTMVLAMKLAELLAAHARGTVPPFLLDDVGSELDPDRTARLVDVLIEVDAQVFATTTHPRHLAALPAAETRLVRVHGGQLESA